MSPGSDGEPAKGRGRRTVTDHWDEQDALTAAADRRLAAIVDVIRRAREVKPAAPCPRCSGRALQIVTESCSPTEWWPGQAALRAHVQARLAAEGLTFDALPAGGLILLKARIAELGKAVPSWRA